MKKWFIIPLILILSAVFLVGMSYQKPEAFDKGKVYEIVREIYPDVKNITEVIPYPECGELCLNVTFVTENDEKIQLTIDLNKGKTLPPNQSENETCVGWWCNATPCDYEIVQSVPEGRITLYNNGCDGYTPTCDQEHEKCRPCQSSPDCLRINVTELENETVYTYIVINTTAWGTINNIDYVCNIYYNGSLLFSNETSISECENMMASATRCLSDGSCNFTVTFEMIPP